MRDNQVWNLVAVVQSQAVNVLLETSYLSKFIQEFYETRKVCVHLESVVLLGRERGVERP